MPPESPEKPPRSQEESDADEVAAIQRWERHHPRPAHHNELLHEGDVYSTWLDCALCGHRQVEKVQKGMMMRMMCCRKCGRISHSRIPD